MSLIEPLTKFLVETQFGDLPRAIVHEAKRSFLDFMAAAFAGCDHAAIRMLMAALASGDGHGDASVIGETQRTSGVFAALINGAMAHVEDYDDTHMPSMLHPGSVVVPAVASVGERRRIDGRRALLACVLGYEVGTRLGNAMCRSHAVRGWHTTGTVGTVAALTGAGKALGLDEQRLAMGFGLAATQASGLIAVFGTMAKALNVGRAAMNGVLAATLAGEGFTAPPDLLESEQGFGRVFADELDASWLLDGLGLRWETARVGRKPYPCGVVTHPVIDAALEIRARLGGRLSQIRHVSVWVHPYVLFLTGKPRPRTGLEGKFSVAHCAAVALLDGAAGPRQFSEERVNDPKVIALREKVAVVRDEMMRTDETLMEVIGGGGLKVDCHVEHACGTVENPMTDEQLTAKFRAAAYGHLPPDRIERLLEETWSLEGVKSLDEFMALCAPRS